VRRIVNGGLSGCAVFFSGAIFGKVTENEMYFDFLNNLYLKHFLFSEELSELLSYMYTRLHVKYPLFLSDFYVSSLGFCSLNSHAEFSSVSESQGWLYPCGC